MIGDAHLIKHCGFMGLGMVRGWFGFGFGFGFGGAGRYRLRGDWRCSSDQALIS